MPHSNDTASLNAPPKRSLGVSDGSHSALKRPSSSIRSQQSPTSGRTQTFFDTPEHKHYVLACLYSRKEETHRKAYEHLCIAAHFIHEREALLLDSIQGPKIINEIYANGHDQAVHELAIQYYKRANAPENKESNEKKEQHRLIAFKLCQIIEVKWQKKKKPIPEDVQYVLYKGLSAHSDNIRETVYKRLYSAAHLPNKDHGVLLDPIQGKKIITDILANGYIEALCDVALLHHAFASDENTNAATELKDKHRSIALKLCDIIAEKCQKNQTSVPKEIQDIQSQAVETSSLILAPAS